MAKNKQFYVDTLISQRAQASFTGDVGRGNLINWLMHWLAVAGVVKDEFIAEGLMNTALYVDDCIERVMQDIKHKERTDKLVPYLDAFVQELETTNQMGGPAMQAYAQKRQEFETTLLTARPKLSIR